MFHHSLLVYRELFAFGTTYERGTNWGKKSELRVSFPDSQLLPKTLYSEHRSGDSCRSCPTEGAACCPPTLPWPSKELQASGNTQPPSARGGVTVLCKPAVPPREYQPTNSCTVSYTTTWSTIQYSQVTIYITPQHQESILPDTKCYFTPAAENSETSSTKESIWLLRTNKL